MASRSLTSVSSSLFSCEASQEIISRLCRKSKELYFTLISDGAIACLSLISTCYFCIFAYWKKYWTNIRLICLSFKIKCQLSQEKMLYYPQLFCAKRLLLLHMSRTMRIGSYRKKNLVLTIRCWVENGVWKAILLKEYRNTLISKNVSRILRT